MSRWRSMLGRILRIEQVRGAGDSQQVLRDWYRGVVPEHPDALALVLRMEQFLVEAMANTRGHSLNGEPASRRGGWPDDDTRAEHEFEGDGIRARHRLVVRALAGDRDAVERLALLRRADCDRRPGVQPTDD